MRTRPFVALVAALALAVTATQARAARSQDSKSNPGRDACAARLAKLYPVLRKYAAANGGKLPEELFDLHREDYVRDASELYCPGNLIGTDRPEQATTYRVRYRMFSGELAVLSCDEARHPESNVLRADGTIFAEPLRPSDYGYVEPLPFLREVSDAALERPSARLGLVLREVEAKRPRMAVVVEGIVPGYVQSFGAIGALSNVRPSDQVLNVSGHQVTTLEELDRFMATLRSTRPTFEILRDGKVLRRWSLVRPSDLEDDARPKDCARWAATVLSPEGPGTLGVMPEDDPAGGARVKEIIHDGAAVTAGLAVGDRIIAVEAHPIRDALSLRRRITAYRAGVTVRVDVMRGPERKRFEAKLGQAPMTTFTDAQRFNILASRYDVEGAMKYAASVPKGFVEEFQAAVQKSGGK